MKAYIVEKDRLKNNIDLVRQAADGRMIYGVLKGNGYGLGLVALARELRDSGIFCFAVNEPKDALKLRMAGFIDEEILVMNSTSIDEEIQDIIEAKAVATIGSYDTAVKLQGYAEARGEIIEAHIKLDTGMGRFGFNPSEIDKILSLYRFMPKIAITGIYSHSNMAFSKDDTAEREKAELLATVQKIREAGFDPGCVHMANSAFLFGHDMEGTNAVRVGSAFLGRVSGKGKQGLMPVGHAEAVIGELRWLPAGHSVGYGAAYVCRDATRIAIVPFGYNDGFGVSRENDLFRLRDKLRYIYHDIMLLFRKKRLYVTINGKKAPVLGHIGMVHTIVDVTRIPCEVGDIASLDVSPLYCSDLVERIFR